MKILYFASLREELGVNSADLDIKTPISVQELRVILIEKYSKNKFNESLLCAVNQEFADDKNIINSGDEIAFFPAVTGG